MPIFEFSCNKCGKVCEKLLSFEESEKGTLQCPCGKGELKKNPVSQFNFALKGNWFKNNGTY